MTLSLSFEEFTAPLPTRRPRNKLAQSMKAHQKYYYLSNMQFMLYYLPSPEFQTLIEPAMLISFRHRISDAPSCCPWLALLYYIEQQLVTSFLQIRLPRVKKVEAVLDRLVDLWVIQRNVATFWTLLERSQPQPKWFLWTNEMYQQCYDRYMNTGTITY